MKTKFTFLTVAAIALALAFKSSEKQLFEQEPERPNILFIMSDDHTTQAFGCYGSRLADLDPTPTLDGLAAEGYLFDNALVSWNVRTIP